MKEYTKIGIAEDRRIYTVLLMKIKNVKIRVA